ncbi:hypothetical protein [Nocardioides lacusdianchii]|uniref:hypothetical protein n=1 Tax=Nocardioides lacusdianchii TaxID=2783664 RepID=UPI001CCFC6A2|nr:hypothetical protein [Nocardioides lacusdianchii]
MSDVSRAPCAAKKQPFVSALNAGISKALRTADRSFDVRDEEVELVKIVALVVVTRTMSMRTSSPAPPRRGQTWRIAADPGVRVEGCGHGEPLGEVPLAGVARR